jgi:DNA processing protein
MNRPAPSKEDINFNSISPMREMGAYEALWSRRGMSWKRMADMFRSDPHALPSDFVPPSDADAMARRVLTTLKDRGVNPFGVRIHHAGEYPVKLRDAKNPVEMLYYQGVWELSEMPGLCIVGSRKASEDGQRRAARMAKELVNRGYAVVSGLATGIDSAAHNAALEAGGTTIAVIGTPLGEFYPKENQALQKKIAKEHLLISQVPVVRYSEEPFLNKRQYFPERNATMSAMTEGTIIVEASETSGTLTQARAALHQRRKLFILDSCFQRADITWPARFEKQGAVRVRTPEDIWGALDQ